MDIWRSLSGQVEVSFTSAQPETDLEALACLGLTLENLEKTDELSYRLTIPRRDWKKMKAFCQKRGNSIRLEKRRGLFWKGKALLHRPVLVLGLGFLLGLTLYLPSRVLFVEVEGNHRVPQRQILEAAEDCGLSFWAPRWQVRSERLKNALLAALPELQWAGVNTRGCVATISVRERAMEKGAAQPVYSSIVAARDGFLLSTTVTQGTALCAPGQTVKAGQALISGYTDCGLTIRFDGAQGEIFAQTNRALEAVCPLTWQEKQPDGPAKRKFGLTLGKKRIIFWKDSGILEGTCGRMVWQYSLTLPGGFSLPVTLWVETYPQVQLTQGEWPGLADSLTEFGEHYLLRRMIGGTIQSRRQVIREEGGLARLTGAYVCREMIGRGRTEQMEDIHGKTN